MTDKDRPSTWIKFKPSLCNNCSAGCCTMPVEITSDDVARLGLAGEEELRSERKSVVRRLTKEKILKSYRSSTQLFMLESQTDGSCIYLDSNRLCKVYDKRPGVCREFPRIGPRPGYCPSAPKRLTQRPEKPY